MRPILSIKELANHALSASNFKKMFNKPKNNISYIVRENITAYVIPANSQIPMKIKSEEDEQMVSNLKLADCKTSLIKAGDILQVVGQVFLMHSSASSTFSAKVKFVWFNLTTFLGDNSHLINKIIDLFNRERFEKTHTQNYSCSIFEIFDT